MVARPTREERSGSTRKWTDTLVTERGSDRFLLFSSDYPHWHYDGLNPLPAGFPTGLLEKIAVENPTETYPRLQKETAQ